MDRIVKPSGHYAVVEWEVGSEEGQLHIDGVSTRKQAIALCYTHIWRTYGVPRTRVRIKGVFVAGGTQAIFRPSVGEV